MSPLCCPLCKSSETSVFFQLDSTSKQNKNQQQTEYYRCDICQLIFLHPQHFLTKEQQKIHYDTHQNNPDDPGYRLFLDKLFLPMIELIEENSTGLDFGSGPGPTLSLMFEEHGHNMKIYDYIYAPDTSVLDMRYDFISCTETIEHFQMPNEEFNQIWQCLKPDGYLGLMTEFYNSNIDFSSWRYRRDPTHVCFYTQKTVDWLCDHLYARKVYEQDNVVILKKLTRDNNE